MVASRWPQRLDFLAAAIKRSISAVVRYSRVRTEEFTVVGADRPPLRFSTIFCPRSKTTSELSAIPRRSALIPSRTLVHGPPWFRASEATRVRRRRQNVEVGHRQNVEGRFGDSGVLIDVLSGEFVFNNLN